MIHNLNRSGVNTTPRFSSMSNIIFNKAGGNAGANSKGCKLSLPSSWVKQLGINELEREVRIDFDGEKITASKKLTIDEFIEKKLNEGHHMRLSHTLCKPPVWCIIGTPHWRI